MRRGNRLKELVSTSGLVVVKYGQKVIKRTYSSDDEDDAEGVGHGRYRQGHGREHLAQAASGQKLIK